MSRIPERRQTQPRDDSVNEPRSLDKPGPELPGLRYESFLGSGGYADVYLYTRESVGVRVAVKLMKSSVLDESRRRQFIAEADAMAALASHPFIVAVLGAGTAPDGRPYIEMQYYPASDLAVRVAQAPLSVPEALRYGIQLASAVETAHRAGIIHRDIKPSNILLSAYGQPGLSDFGIAGRPNDAADDSEVGVSLPWSPPEVLTGVSNGSVVSDVYSLGATIWNLLVGHPPFHIPGGDNSERATFTRIVHSRPPSPGRGDAPASLDRLLQQSLAKDPSHRPQSAIELARGFQRVEQELRLARTEVMVPSESGDIAVASLPAPQTVPRARVNPGVSRVDKSGHADGNASATTDFQAPQTTGEGQPPPAQGTRLGRRDARDVFISHAGEDKKEVASPLAALLIAQGWSIWLDQLELTVGDSLNQQINAALARSQFGVVVLSPAFFIKEWPRRELDGLAARETTTGAKIILPVWHGIDAAFLAERAPMLADRLGVSTALGLEHVATELVRAFSAAGRSPVPPGQATAMGVTTSIERTSGWDLSTLTRVALASWWMLPLAAARAESRIISARHQGRTTVSIAFTRNYRKGALSLARHARYDIAGAGCHVASCATGWGRSTMIAVLRQMAQDEPNLLAAVLRRAFEASPRDVIVMCYEAGLPIPDETFTATYLSSR